ncbi:predicted protein [Naegleria gruberi]|uniref:Predicted protein n=1 Tax=Naegleria gruberi TaxID=5762 RepID=D2VJ35_NAEGR|nr:uncharacterized protein NAEGRDRAFT_49954 [Naegleria gruberi]EFC43130.1 predicted protein [Naegleria gruberi]|eukprot:XP_002675874.1 predicted protein [Naegleria gruberi strain NEG-M]
MDKCPEDGFLLPEQTKDFISRSLRGQQVEVNDQEINVIETPQVDEPITVQILTLGGSVCQVKTNKKHSIITLKEEIEKYMDIPVGKQSLFFRNTELENYNNGMSRRVGDFGIQDNDKIYLSILMKEIDVGDNINAVKVRLQWNWVNSRDFLDGIVYVLDGNNNITARLDYDNNVSPLCGESIFHKGDDIDNDRKLGCQIIGMNLENIPMSVQTIVFTLSSYRASSLSSFKNPRVHIEEETRGQPLAGCDTDAIKSQAIIVCAFRRSQQGWRIIQINRESSGNAQNDSALITSIIDVVRNL